MEADRIRPYVKDVVYGANDGIITTFAVVSGVVGAALPTRVILVIGVASLLADGLSMAASDFLASRSQAVVDETACPGRDASPFMGALLTFVAFVVAGATPLAPYVFVRGRSDGLFLFAAGATAAALFAVGALRSLVTRRGFLRSGLEMLLIGGAAAVVAFGIGRGLGAVG